ncbi:hypothetical protein ACIQVA_38780 [Streptomyces microflavus]
MLTENADDLNVRVPSVTEYTTHLSSVLLKLTEAQWPEHPLP